MKIALLHYAAHPVVGGVENVMQVHASLWAGGGHKVRIIAGRGEQVDPRVDFMSIPLVDSLAPEILTVKDKLDRGEVPPEFPDLSQQIEKQLLDRLDGFDWLIAHNVCSLGKNLALTDALHRISQHGSPRLVLWHHDLAWSTPRYRAELHEGHPWNLLKLDWPSVKQVTVSEARRRELARLLDVPPTRIHVVPNGIDQCGFLDIDDGTCAMADELGLWGADPLLLLPARVTRRKNIELALRILARARSRLPKPMLLITGPVGPHNTRNRAYLDSLLEQSDALGLQESAVFLTHRTGTQVSDATMRQLYRLADALLLPSREEGFGIPILEAGLAGIPVFCSKIPPFAELGGSEVELFSLDENPSSIADRLVDFLERDRRHRFRKRVSREYAWSAILKDHLNPLLQPGTQ